MPTLLFRFPGGRYHATPWGHHVNEGMVEWPPSPWRLLRALIASGYATHGWTEVPPVGRRLLAALASTLPRYRLPPASLAHTRHFMPQGVFDKGREKTTLVFDTWADIGDGSLVVRWDCPLDDEATGLLARLTANLGYLGRSESWVIAELLADDDANAQQFDAYPHADASRPGPGWEQVSLMAAEGPEIYSKWREEEVIRVLASMPSPPQKTVSAALKKKQALAVKPYPADLLDCLQKDTAWWKEQRWSQPPGSRRVLYWRRSDSLSVGPPAHNVPQAPGPVNMMLLALTTPSGSRSALPTVARTLPQAELLHKALVSRAGNGDPVNCPELTGRDERGKPLRGHQHAQILPLDLDRDGHLDHVLIYARMGLGPIAQQAVRALKRTWMKGGAGELRVALAGEGGLDQLRTLPAALREEIGGLLGPTGGSLVWQSATPLVLPRFQKPRGANTFEGQVAAELAARRLPEATADVLPWDDENLRLRHAVRTRRRPAKQPPVDAGFVVRLTFATPVIGPLALGYGAHYGLGLFASVRRE